MDWLGCWSFHDFEMVALPPVGATDGNIQVRGWVTDWHAADERGFFRRSKFCRIEIRLGGISRTTVSASVLPAIIFDLDIIPVGEQLWRVEWTSSYGVEGAYEAETVLLSMTPQRNDESGELATRLSTPRPSRSA